MLPVCTGPDSPGLNNSVVIVIDLGDDVQRYAQEFAQFILPHPAECPQCAVVGHLVGHGSYARRVTDPTESIAIRIKRLLCTACRQTISLLPTFCLPFRHYQTATIQTVLTLRLETHASWSRIRHRFRPADLPTRTTCREWVDSFRRASGRYLPLLVRHLATWSTRSSELEVALAEVGAQSTAPTQLIAAVPHLLVGLRDAGLRVADGARCWLATLWQWGHGAKIGRLV